MNIHKQEILESIFDTFNKAVSTGSVEDPSIFMERMIDAAQGYEKALFNEPCETQGCNEDCDDGEPEDAGTILMEKTMHTDAPAPQIVRIPAGLACGMLRGGRESVDMVELDGRTYVLREIYPTACKYDFIHVVVVICDDNSGQLYMANFDLGMDLRSHSDFRILDDDDNVIFRKAKEVKRVVSKYEYD